MTTFEQAINIAHDLTDDMTREEFDSSEYVNGQSQLLSELFRNEILAAANYGGSYAEADIDDVHYYSRLLMWRAPKRAQKNTLDILADKLEDGSSRFDIGFHPLFVGDKFTLLKKFLRSEADKLRWASE